MTKLSIYCLSMSPNHLDKIKKIGYIPVGLGDKSFSRDWLNDSTGDNISSKNKYYGEYTFHYWVWKNYLDRIDDGWIGFCQYRKFWAPKKPKPENNSFEEFEKIVLKELSSEYDKYDSIIGEPFFINQFRLTKFLKRNLVEMILNPSLIFNSKSRNIKFHFDMWHGKGNLDKAVQLLEEKEKDDFTKFINTNISFNPQNMFICRSKEILKNYYQSVFPWLKKCESVFGFDDL